jgi:hypothetical protein
MKCLLSDSKQKSIDTYGKPNEETITEGVEKLEWIFVGDIIYDKKTSFVSRNPSNKKKRKNKKSVYHIFFCIFAPNLIKQLYEKVSFDSSSGRICVVFLQKRIIN